MLRVNFLCANYLPYIKARNGLVFQEVCWRCGTSWLERSGFRKKPCYGWDLQSNNIQGGPIHKWFISHDTIQWECCFQPLEPNCNADLGTHFAHIIAVQIISKFSNINWSVSSAAYMRQWTGSALFQVCRLFGTKPLPEPVLPYCLLDP